MNIANLKEIIRLPSVHKRLLGAYHGAYSLGVSKRAGGEYVLLLFVEDKNPEGFPETITVDGTTVPVIVQGSFTAPRALGEQPKRVRHKTEVHRDAA